MHANGMISATNLVVRQQFGNGGPVIALNAHGDVVPPGAGWTHDPYGAEVVDDPEYGATMYGRGVAVSKSDFATYTFTLLALRALAASGAKLNGAIELHLTYDEEVGGEIGPGWLLAQGLSKADLRAERGLFLRGDHRAQRLPASGSDRARPAGACGDARARHRCARRGDADPDCDLCLARGLEIAHVEDSGHHPSDLERRPDRGRHQYQCRAGSRRVPHRPTHHSGRIAGRR